MTNFVAFCRQKGLLALASSHRRFWTAAIVLASASPAMAAQELKINPAETNEPYASVPHTSGTVTFQNTEPTLLANEWVGANPGEAPAADDSAPVLGIHDLEAGVDPRTVPAAADDDMAQVTSVSEFTDVLPTDWAFQALQNLVETYGCIEGYPDGTYRGQRSLTRFEFAAGLNSCLNVVAQLAGEEIDPEELAAIQQLQEEFRAELLTLGGRVEAREADVAELQAQQFSTVTKLRGRVFAHIGGGFRGGDITAEGASIFNPGSPARDASGNPILRTIDRNPGTTVGSLAWINFDTSFTGDDLLKLQLVMGSGQGPANLYGSAGLFNTFGTPFTFQTGGTSNFAVNVRELSYQFPVGNRLTIDAGFRVNWYSYFDNNRYTFFLTGANSFNSSGGTQVNAVDRGAGAIAVWDITDWLDLRLGYLAENTEFLRGDRSAFDA